MYQVLCGNKINWSTIEYIPLVANPLDSTIVTFKCANVIVETWLVKLFIVT